ncbi:MAG: helix-turn-helix transcriptional regulator [Bacteroidetes bacterium]|nr:helix-turn-helix transcriptional regulator [Bacteroidota bacterium]
MARTARTLRLAQGLTQHELASRLGTSQPNISAAERGKDPARLPLLLRMLTALCSPPSGPYYFLSDESTSDL